LTFSGIVDRGNWSPDGKHFAFHVAPGFADYVLDIDPDAEIRKPEGAKPVTRLVTAAAFGMIGPDWSPDGRYLYATRPGDIYRIMRVPAAGGEVEDLFEGDGLRVEPYGNRIYYGKQGLFGLFARSLEGDVRSNPEERIVSDYVAPRGFDVNRRGVYYLGRDSARKPVAIRFFDFALRRSFDIAPAPLGPLPSIAVAPDGTRLLYDTLSESVRSLTLMKLTRASK
jgi:dipeptidyl aminopeptidase/acylaminoacyl peptidase